MIRPAKFVDIPGIVAMIQQMHEVSRYADMDDLEPDVSEVKRLCMQAIQRHGQQILGGMFAMVAEKDGKIEGVLLAALDRIQCFYNRFYATDLIWLATPAVDPRDPGKLLDAMVEWAQGCPKCRLITLGATNAVGDYQRTGKLIARRGFEQFGAIYQKEVVQ